MIIAFILLLGIMAYVYVGYPLLLLPLSLLRRRRPSRKDENCPSLAVLIPARNEADGIQEKIGNTLAADYPAGRLEVLVGVDACTDDTFQRASAITDKRLRIVQFPERVGKCGVLNHLAGLTNAEVLVMSDSDVAVESGAFRLLATHFSDARVGAVCGRRSHHNDSQAGFRAPARLYNVYESAIKRGEGFLYKVLGADGSLYALRRSLFQPVPAGVPDDFVNVLRVLKAGSRVLYENDAVSRETLASDATYQFVRKRRTVARGLRGLWMARELLNPFGFPLTSFLLLSHKLLRWLTSFFLFALLIVNLMLVRHPVFLLTFCAQVVFYLLAGLAAWLPFLRNCRLCQVVRYFVVVNVAAAAGILDALRGRAWTTWEGQPGFGNVGKCGFANRETYSEH